MWNNRMLIAALFVIGLNQIIKAQLTPPDILNVRTTETPTNPLLQSGAIWNPPTTPTNPPIPLPGFSVRDASWGYFWMWDDGVFIKNRSNTFRTFNAPATDNTREVVLAVRGRYTSDDEPPPKKQIYLIAPGDFPNTSNSAVPAVLMSESSELELIAQENAAIVGDSIFFAARIKNRSQTGGRDATLRILFSSDSLLYRGTPFPADAPNQVNYPPSASFAPSTEARWNLENFGAGEERTFFFVLQVKSRRDTSGINVIYADVQWDDETSVPINSNILGYTQTTKDKTVTQPNPIYFEREASTAIAINKGRDPNSLEVWPMQVAPITAPEYTLNYTVHVENIGSVAVPEIEVLCSLDPRLDMSTLNLIESSLKIKIAVTSTENLKIASISGNQVKFTLKYIKLNVPGSGENQASFEFTIKTKNSTPLVAGDQIVSIAEIYLKNNGMEHDRVTTKPAVTHCAVPGRIPFGSILGVKLHHHIPNAEAAEGTGASLTYMIPLLNPRGNSLFDRRLRYLPRLWYQAEIGYGRGAFENNSQRIETNYLHFNPIQIRGVFKSKLPTSNIGFYWGISAGYSVDYIQKARANGSDLRIPDGFSNRLEHELAVSLDALNIMTAPGLSVSAGYKFRSNQLVPGGAQYGFPYLAAQFNFFRFRRNYLQFLNNAYYR